MMTKAKIAKLQKAAFEKAQDQAIAENGETRVFANAARVRAYAKSRGLSYMHIGDGEFKIG